MTWLEVILVYAMLHILMAVIMAVFPRDEVMRIKTGISSYTERPVTVGDYFFNGLVVLMCGGGLMMEYINGKIVKRRWWCRIGIRIVVIFSGFLLVFVAGVLSYVFSES